MRNGNVIKFVARVHACIVLTVPMRNGNIPGTTNSNTTSSGSYRTYEEWKPIELMTILTHTNFSSYRTYEEWKLPSHLHTLKDSLSSYRTYEEWKHFPLSI